MSIDQFLLSATTTDLNYPEVRPTLDLNFARTKTLDPRITFTRASGGSYVGADGLMKVSGVNEARFDHDFVTGESLGLLIEESRTNLLPNSDVVGTIGSDPTNAIIPYKANGQSMVVSNDVFIGPNGFSAKHTKGSQIGDSNAGYYGYFHTAGELNNTFTASFYLYIPSTQASRMSSEVVITAEGIGVTNMVIGRANMSLVDRWQRIYVTYTPTSASFVGFVLRHPGPAGTIVYSDAWQLEQGAFPTSYIPTVGSTRTRAADDARITGKNFSDFFNFNEGTFFVDGSWPIPNNANINYPQFSFGAGGRGSFDYFITFADFSRFSYFPAIGGEITNSGITITNNKSYKSSVSYDTYSSLMTSSIDGNSVVTTNSNRKIEFDTKAQNILRIGSSINLGSTPLNGTIRRHTYFPKRLPNAQLQALTR